MDIQKIISEKTAIVIAIFIAGLCSIVYELLISTTTSYFLGDSIRQFSLTIGIYMAAMGLGSFFSKLLPDSSLTVIFIIVEALLGLVGGCSVPILYYCFESFSRAEYQALMIGLTTIIGILTGFEIPLLARIMKKYYPLRVNLANVMSLDYFGALAATLLFPFLLLPMWGLFRTSVFFGLINVALGLFILGFFAEHLSSRNKILLSTTSLVVMAAFGALLFWANPLLERWDNRSFSHRVVFNEQTPYQHLVMTKNKEEVRLYINRIIQFSSADEYRYHEALGIIPLEMAPYKKNVLVLGGGEGLLARELLKSEEVDQITIVDLDPEVFRLAKENTHLRTLNEEALYERRVHTVAQDASIFLRESGDYYDLIISDLPDPSNEAVARLYSTHFFKLAKARLTPNGVFATQATSPFHTRNGFWCIYETLKAVGYNTVLPYHTYVPSFGDWGFIVASNQPLEPLPFTTKLPVRYLTEKTVSSMFDFPPDTDNPGGLKINRLDQPALLDYYLEDWAKWSREKIR
jgi:spermidine synthase